jgi:hypothetical protein
MLRFAFAIAICTLVASPAVAQKGEQQKNNREQRANTKTVVLRTSVSPVEQQIRAALLDPTNLEFVETPLKEALTYISDKHKIDTQYDMVALRDAGIDPTAIPVSINVHEIKLLSALNLILSQNDLAFIIENEVLQITTKQKADAKLIMRTYDVSDLADNDNVNQFIDIISSTPSGKYELGVIKPLRRNNAFTIFVSKPIAVHEEIQQVLADLRAVNAKAGQ